MAGQSAITSAGPASIYKLFDAVQYVDNPYALLAFAFLAVVVFIGFGNIARKARAAILAVLAIAIVAVIFLLLSDTLRTVEDRTVVHLVKAQGRQSAEIAPNVVVSLVEIETLKGRGRDGGGLAFNMALPGEVRDRVFEIAGVATPELTSMSEEEWGRFLDRIDQTDANQLRHTPFARIRIEVDGEVVEEAWRFKGDSIRVPSRDLTIGLLNVYNTRSLTSGEPEAVNIRVCRQVVAVCGSTP